MAPLFELEGLRKRGKEGSSLFLLCHKSNPPTYRDDAVFYVVIKDYRM